MSCPIGLRILAAGGAALLAVLPALAQADAPEPKVFTGETTVIAVEVPVQVLWRGEPVRGLTAADFAVYEGEERRELTGFEVVDLGVAGSGVGTEVATGTGTAAPPAEPVPAAGRRHFLLLFDLSFTQLGHLYRGIEGARGLLESGLHPSDVVAVAFYHDRRGANLVL